MKRTALAAALAFAAVVVAVGCTQAPGSNGTSSASASATASPSTSAAGSAMPFSIDKIITSFDGTATEVLQVPSYTYVAVTTVDGDTRWVASLKKPIHVGDAVHVHSFGEKADFASAKLGGRVFSKLYFAVVTKNV